jgi:ankyrin repeat protein
VTTDDLLIAVYGPQSIFARVREEMPQSKKKRSQAARGQLAGGGQLLNAAMKGDAAAVARLLAAGADPNALVTERLPSGEVVQSTALVMAGRPDNLLAAGHDPDRVLAAILASREAARLLLDGGADPSLAGGDGCTPLMNAAGDGHLKALRLLLGRGAAVDAVHPVSGWTAFHDACCYNHAECAEALARAGCDVGLKDVNGKTGRELAEAEGHAAVVERLRELAGAAGAGGVAEAEPAEGHAAVVERLRAVVTAEQLRAAPAPAPEPVAVVCDGGPADQLLDAAGEGDVAAVARLLTAGAVPNASVAARVPSGEVIQFTALCAAARCGRLEAVRLLLESGANPSLADGNGETPLMVAAANEQLEVLRLLLARGAAVDAVSAAYGATAFHYSCYSNQPKYAEALARAGCDVRLKDSNGKTGQELAESRGSKEVARQLRALARQPFVGVLVELAGLVGAAEHNGKRATVHPVLARQCHCVLRVSCSNSLPHSAYRRITVRGSCMAVKVTAPGARCCATCQRSGATRWSCWSRRPGAAVRGSAWMCGRRTLCWRICRSTRGAPRPGGCDGSPGGSLVFSTRTLELLAAFQYFHLALTATSPMEHADSCSLARTGSR